MGISRHRVATTRRLRSEQRIWFCLHNNQSEKSEEIRREEVLLESENFTYNQDKKTQEEA